MNKKASIRPPRFLSEVLQAIYELKERGGSNTANIKDYIKTFLKDGRCPTTTLNTQVRRALQHAKTEGIVKYQGGKFKINTNIVSTRRRPNSQKKRRRLYHRPSNHRKYFAPTASVSSESNYEDSSANESDVPISEIRRHKKRSGRRRRRSRRRSLRDEDDMDYSDDDITFGYYY